MPNKIDTKQINNINKDLNETKDKFLIGLKFFMKILNNKLKAKIASEEFLNICNNQLELVKYFEQQVQIINKNLEYYLYTLNLKGNKDIGKILVNIEKAFLLAHEKIKEERGILEEQEAYLENTKDINRKKLSSYLNKESKCIKSFFKNFERINISDLNNHIKEINRELMPSNLKKIENAIDNGLKGATGGALFGLAYGAFGGAYFAGSDLYPLVIGISVGLTSIIGMVIAITDQDILK